MSVAQDLRNLAELDSAIASAQHQRDHLPAASELAAVETHLRKIAADFKELSAAKAPVAAQRDELEATRSTLSARLVDLRTKLDASTGGARDLAALSGEIDAVSAKLDDADTQELEILELLEPFEAQEHALRVAGQPLMTQRLELMAAVEAGQAELDDILARHRLGRPALIAALPEDLAATYGRILARVHDTAAVDVVDGRCGGCRIALVPLDLERWRDSGPEAFVACPECSRLFLRPC